MSRFLFVHRKKRRFVWLEVKDATLLRAEGAAGEEASATPTEQVYPTAAAATRHRDAATAKLLDEGYALADFAAPPAAKKARAKTATATTTTKAKRALASNPELEARVRERDDDESWQIFEDWLLESDDPRREIIACEKARDRAGAAEARGRLTALLFGGERSKLVTEQVRAQTWRAGFARDPVVALLRSADRCRELGRILASSPALALARDLTLEVEAKGTEEPFLEELGKSIAASSVRSLLVQGLMADRGQLDAAVLAPFVRLERLRLIAAGLELRYAPNLASLSSIELHALPADEITALFAAGHFAELRSLTLDVGYLEGGLGAVLAPLLEGTCAPKLTTLRLRQGRLNAIVEFLARLAESPLAPRLEALSLGGIEGSRELLPGRGAAFRALTRLELPTSLVPAPA